jgi:hypothetical protein
MWVLTDNKLFFWRNADKKHAIVSFDVSMREDVTWIKQTVRQLFLVALR